MRKETKNALLCAILIILFVVSLFICAPYAKSAEKHKAQLNQIDESISSVSGLAGTTAAVSAVVTLLPGDVATPDANEIADLLGYLMMTISILFAEKYLLLILGYIVFKYIIPITCVIGIIDILLNCQKLRNVIIKTVLISLIIAFTIPIGLEISNIITDTYSASYNDTLAIGQNITEAINENTNISDMAEDILKSVTDFMRGVVEGIAVTILASCIVPICTFSILIWLIKTFVKPTVKVDIPALDDYARRALPEHDKTE